MGIEEPLILIVEDDPQVRKLLCTALRTHSFRVAEAVTATEGLRHASTRTPDLILLDLTLPDGDGLSVIREIREWSSVPIIIVSARELEDDKVAALDGGADDYVSKPFGGAELLARVRVALRHAAQRQARSEDAAIVVGDLEVNLAAHTVSYKGSELHLTPIEFRLVSMLARNAGKVLTHRQLLRDVWGPPYEREIQYLRGYMAQLRRKLEVDPAAPTFIVTEPGIGYRMLA